MKHRDNEVVKMKYSGLNDTPEEGPSKGGRNKKPTVPRPETPPKGQVRDLTKEQLKHLDRGEAMTDMEAKTPEERHAVMSHRLGKRCVCFTEGQANPSPAAVARVLREAASIAKQMGIQADERSEDEFAQRIAATIEAMIPESEQ